MVQLFKMLNGFSDFLFLAQQTPPFHTSTAHTYTHTSLSMLSDSLLVASVINFACAERRASLFWYGMKRVCVCVAEIEGGAEP